MKERIFDKKHLVIVVDCQYDFCNPKGSLYVPESEVAIENIKTLLKTIDNNFIVFTQDYHPEDHCSFIENGGQWPKHCVKDTEGVKISPELISTLRNGDHYAISKKGTDANVEEYSAFLNESVTFVDNKFIVSMSDEVIVITYEEVVICGVAGDYCVLETLKTLYDRVEMPIRVYLEGVKSINPEPNELTEFMNEKNIESYEIQ